MNRFKKIFLVSLLILCLVGCDYTSKKLAQSELKNKQAQSYLGGTLQFVYAENTGGMLSFGSKLAEGTKIIIFKHFTVLVTFSLFLFTIWNKKLTKYTNVALIFIISGGAGNLIDRFANEGRVVDFIIVSFFSLHTGVFNLADLYVTIGVITFVSSSLFKKIGTAQSF